MATFSDKEKESVRSVEAAGEAGTECPVARFPGLCASARVGSALGPTPALSVSFFFPFLEDKSIKNA